MLIFKDVILNFIEILKGEKVSSNHIIIHIFIFPVRAGAGIAELSDDSA